MLDIMHFGHCVIDPSVLFRINHEYVIGRYPSIFISHHSSRSLVRFLNGKALRKVIDIIIIKSGGVPNCRRKTDRLVNFAATDKGYV